MTLSHKSYLNQSVSHAKVKKGTKRILLENEENERQLIYNDGQIMWELLDCVTDTMWSEDSLDKLTWQLKEEIRWLKMFYVTSDDDVSEECQICIF